MLSTILLAAATAFSALTTAQNFTLPGQGNYSIVPDSVPIEERYSWCNGQQATCFDLCNNQASPHSCDPETLEWACTCLNGPTPNISEYMNTIPVFECNQWKGDCLAYYAGNAQEQDGCSAVVCGDKNASSAASPSSSSASMPSKTSSAAKSPTKTASQTSSSPAATTNSSSGTVINVAVNYSTGILSVALFAIFGLAL